MTHPRLENLQFSKKKKKCPGDTVMNTSDMALAYVLAEATEMKDITT